MSFNSWRSLCLGCALFYFFSQLAPLVWGDAHYCCVYWNPSPQDDAPRALITQAKLSAKANDSMWESKYTCMGTQTKIVFVRASTKSLLLHLQLWTTKVNNFELSNFFALQMSPRVSTDQAALIGTFFSPQNPSLCGRANFLSDFRDHVNNSAPISHPDDYTPLFECRLTRDIQLQLQTPRCK